MAQPANAAIGGPSSNGIMTGQPPRGPVAGSRKKQKKRSKTARQPLDQQILPHDEHSQNGHAAHQHYSPPYQHTGHPDLPYDEGNYVEPDQYDPQDDYYSDEEDDIAAYNAEMHGANGHYANPNLPSARKGKKKKAKRGNTAPNMPYNGDPSALLNSAMSQMQLPNPPPPPMSAAALRSVQRSAKQDRIWNTSTHEERERIKEFWLSLSEEERKSLLKIEKEAVLRKMKEQQKHSCSCTVCGRKRTAIEEELEVLYDAYYEELENYANTRPGEGGGAIQPPPPPPPPPPPASRPIMEARQPQRREPYPSPLSTGQRTSRVREIIDDGDEQYDDQDEEEYSEEEYEYSEDDMGPGYRTDIGADFFNFGSSLTVQGGILTVADDLLKNDGKKFIEMMEQLAERRMQREQQVEYAASQPPHSHAPNGQELPYDDEEYDDEEDDYESQDDYDEEEEDPEDEMGGMTESQRMEEGRRMFQIFAARMFEQRVLTAYREKVAAERQRKLLEELEDESRLDAQREAKKAKDNEKKKNKKLAQKQAKAEEKAKKEAEKAAEEAAAREAEEKKQQEQRQKKEEQRRKKEAERKAQEEERLRKEAERVKRQQDERERQQELERKAREQKASEKRQKEEARRKEREEKESREKEVKERKAQASAVKKDAPGTVEIQQRDVKDDKKELQATAPGPTTTLTQPPQIIKRPSQAGAVAVPPGLHPKQSSSGLSSPHISVATPALPKATATTTPARARQSSYQDSHGSSPMATSLSTGPSKSTSPSSAAEPQPASTVPRAILQNPQKQQHQQSQQQQVPQFQPHATQAQPQFAPTPSAPYQQGPNHLGPVGFPPYQGPQAAPGHGGPQRQAMPMMPLQGSMNNNFRPYQQSGNMPGHGPGISGLGFAPQGRSFSTEGAPGFAPSHVGPPGAPSAAPGFGGGSHSRQQSLSTDKSPLDGLPMMSSNQPISRPAPIQRPSSVKPLEISQKRKGGQSGDLDDLSGQLGSSALLDDADEPLPSTSIGSRRISNPPGSVRPGAMDYGAPMFSPQPVQGRLNSFGGAQMGFNPSNTFGHPGQHQSHQGLGNSGWNSGVNSGSWSQNTFGSFGTTTRQPSSRPLAIRLAICNACRQLSQPDSDTWVDVNTLLRQIEMGGSMHDSLPSPKEIEDMCETEGDAQNGGGTLYVRHSTHTNGSAFSVKFEPDSSTPNTGRPSAQLGEIGSPMPSNSMPTFGRAFGGLGGLASPGFG